MLTVGIPLMYIHWMFISLHYMHSFQSLILRLHLTSHLTRAVLECQNPPLSVSLSSDISSEYGVQHLSSVSDVSTYFVLFFSEV